MILIIFASPISAFDMQVVNQEGIIIDKCSSTYENARYALDKLVQKHKIEEAMVFGPQAFTLKIIQELQQYYDFPISGQM